MNFATDTVLTGEDAAPARPPLSPEEIAPHFPQLEVLECLGRGGMGVVYKARQKSLGRLVALKLLAPEREKDPQFAERFAREAQALAQLDHPHIVTIHDFGQTNGYFFLLMEFVDGVNLRELLRTRKLTPEEALAIVPPLCDALQFAHERGIVHRDIKPENLLLAKDGRVKIADFGIARMLGAEAPSAEEKAAGTPGYMAPEQMETPGRADSRADIYSLGVVFYEMLTGELPAGRIEPPSRKVQVDVRIDEIVLKALERTPELRFQTVAELRTSVERMSEAPEPAVPPQMTPSAPDRTWMKVLSFVLLVPGIPLAIFGLVLLWLVLRDPSWHPGYRELIVTLGTWIGALVVLGGSATLFHLSKGQRAGAGRRKRELPPVRPWQQAWLAQPVKRRRMFSVILVLVALGLSACFAWPHREVVTVGRQTTETLAFGFPKPWLTETKLFNPNGNQNWPQKDVGLFAFFAGILGLGLWITLGKLHEAENRVDVLARLNDPSAAPLRPRWRTTAITLFLVAVGLAHSGLLMCAVIPAPPLRTITMAVFFGALGTFMALRRHRGEASLPEGAANTRPLRFIWTMVAGLFVVISLLLFLIIPLRSGPGTPPRSMPVEAVKEEFPGHHSGSYGADGRAAFAVQDAERLHFVLFYDGEFATTSSNAGSNRATRTWNDGGSIRIRNGRTFGFHRDSSYPEMLMVNGVEYDLRKGTLLVLEDDGKVRQLPSFPAPITRDSLPALAAEVAHVEVAAPAENISPHETPLDQPTK